MDRDRLVGQLRALGEPSRLALVLHLAEGERGAGELLQATGLSQPNLSRHLKVLREAGVIAERRQGRNRFYRLADLALAEAILPLAGVSWSAGTEAEPQGAPPAHDAEAHGRGGADRKHMPTYTSAQQESPQGAPPGEEEDDEEPPRPPMEDWLL